MIDRRRSRLTAALLAVLFLGSVPGFSQTISRVRSERTSLPARPMLQLTSGMTPRRGEATLRVNPEEVLPRAYTGDPVSRRELLRGHLAEGRRLPNAELLHDGSMADRWSSRKWSWGAKDAEGTDPVTPSGLLQAVDNFCRSLLTML